MNEIDVEDDAKGCKYIEVVCGGRTGKLMLDKFCKLEGNKGYTKCIEYNGKLMPPQDFESLAGMKAMKSWKKSLKHKSQPLLTYLTSGALKDCDEQGQTVLDNASTLSQTINSAF